MRLRNFPATLFLTTLVAGVSNIAPAVGHEKEPELRREVVQAPSSGIASTLRSRAGTPIYDNTTDLSPNATLDLYRGQAGAESIDEIHAVVGGQLSTISFQYFEPDSLGTSLEAEISLYSNPQGLDADMSPVAGPFRVVNLPPGTAEARLVLPRPVVVDRDFWIGIRFSSLSAGLVINSNPIVGSSHDYYVEDGRFFYFGGSPRANFAVRLEVDGAPITGVPTGTNARLYPARPNPFRRSTILDFDLLSADFVTIDVIDVTGRHVTTLFRGELAAGLHYAEWDGIGKAGRRVPAGTYFVTLRESGGVEAHRTTLID